VDGTPSIFIDGEFYFGARDVGSLREFLATKVGGATGSGRPSWKDMMFREDKTP